MRIEIKQTQMSLILFEIKDRIGYITLNRPEKRNALSPELVSDLKEAFLCLLHFWKNNVCRNCRSVDCKNHKDIPIF